MRTATELPHEASPIGSLYREGRKQMSHPIVASWTDLDVQYTEADLMTVDHIGPDVVLHVAGYEIAVERVELLAALEVEGDELKVAA